MFTFKDTELCRRVKPLFEAVILSRFSASHFLYVKIQKKNGVFVAGPLSRLRRYGHLCKWKSWHLRLPLLLCKVLCPLYSTSYEKSPTGEELAWCGLVWTS